MQTVAVLGAGNMGTALAQVLAENGHSLRLWSIEHDVLEEIRELGTNTKYLSGVSLHEKIEARWKLDQALDGADIALFSVTSQVMRPVVHQAAPHISEACIVLSVAKGLEEGSNLRLSQVLREELGGISSRRIVAMGGPAMAPQFARHAPTAVIVASEDVEAAASIQAAFQNEYFKMETTDDIVGVELCATLKNAYAIALGMADGLGLATNSKAFLVTLALNELANLVTALGGRPETAYGLAGLGDLLTTGFAAEGRNRRLGEKMCTDPNWREFLAGPTLEGVPACQSARALADKHAVSAPLLGIVFEVLCEHGEPVASMQRFLRGFEYE